MNKQKLAQAVNDRARKVTVRGSQVIVPLKFDEEGNPATPDRIILKRLTLNDLRFLQKLRSANWDIEKAREGMGFSREVAERLLKRLSCFREEDARVKALAEIPTPAWIAAKHVENVYEESLTDGKQKSLQELAKISGAYKPTQSVSVSISLEKPSWTPEQEAKLREVFDTVAEEAARAA